MKEDWSQLAFPAIHVATDAYRIVKDISELQYMRYNSIKYTVPQYYWDSTNAWFKATNIRKVRSAPFWLRFRTADDLMVASFDLEELDGQPVPSTKIYRDLAALAKGDNFQLSKETQNVMMSELKLCGRSTDVIAWMNKYVTTYPGY